MKSAGEIHGELLKLDIDVGQTTVAKYMARRRGPTSQGWKTFLCNHADGVVAMDLFVVPTISFRLLYGLLIMGHGRRQILWFGTTAHPTAESIANQLTQACGWEQIPRYLIRDRDRAYGEIFIRRVRSIGIRDRPTSPRSPWQNGYAQRLMGSIRRECIDHIVIFGERHLRHVLLSYKDYYNDARTHFDPRSRKPPPACDWRRLSHVPPAGKGGKSHRDRQRNGPSAGATGAIFIGYQGRPGIRQCIANLPSRHSFQMTGGLRSAPLSNSSRRLRPRKRSP